MNPGPNANDKKAEKCHSRGGPKQTATIKDFKDEDQDWIPEEAFRVAHDFRNKCASSVS